MHSILDLSPFDAAPMNTQCEATEIENCTCGTDEFCKKSVRIALTSGPSRCLVTDDLAVGLSTLNNWVNAHRDTDVASTADRELTQVNGRLRRDIRILREKREIRKQATAAFFRKPNDVPWDISSISG